jgi:hypothetical protein
MAAVVAAAPTLAMPSRKEALAVVVLAGLETEVTVLPEHLQMVSQGRKTRAVAEEALLTETSILEVVQGGPGSWL